jgi:hypothetical protein
MVTVSITAKAFAAIEATLPEGSEAEARRTVRGSISLRCRDVLNKLNYLRAPRREIQRRHLAGGEGRGGGATPPTASPACSEYYAAATARFCEAR